MWLAWDDQRIQTVPPLNLHLNLYGAHTNASLTIKLAKTLVLIKWACIRWLAQWSSEYVRTPVSFQHISFQLVFVVRFTSNNPHTNSLKCRCPNYCYVQFGHVYHTFEERAGHGWNRSRGRWLGHLDHRKINTWRQGRHTNTTRQHLWFGRKGRPNTNLGSESDFKGARSFECCI